jgi:hypothetical protein
MSYLFRSLDTISVFFNKINTQRKNLSSKCLKSIIYSIIFINNHKNIDTLEYWLIDNPKINSDIISFYIETAVKQDIGIHRFAKKFAGSQYTSLSNEEIINISKLLETYCPLIILDIQKNLIKNGKYSALFTFLSELSGADKKQAILELNEKSKTFPTINKIMVNLLDEFPELKKLKTLI